MRDNFFKLLQFSSTAPVFKSKPVSGTLGNNTRRVSFSSNQGPCTVSPF